MAPCRFVNDSVVGEVDRRTFFYCSESLYVCVPWHGAGSPTWAVHVRLAADCWPANHLRLAVPSRVTTSSGLATSMISFLYRS
jgi:hypothetical protein